MNKGEVFYSETVRVDDDERRLIVQWAHSGDLSITVRSDNELKAQLINLPRDEVLDLVARLGQWLEQTEL